VDLGHPGNITDESRLSLVLTGPYRSLNFYLNHLSGWREEVPAVKVPDLLAARARLAPDRTALVDTRSGREFSYAEASRRAGRLAWYLRDQLEVRPGDRVALLCGNRVEVIELLIACGRIGALLVPLNWRLSVPELAEVMRDCTPTALLCDATRASTAEALWERPVILDDAL